MRSVPPALAAKLSAGVTTLAHVWRIERHDGARFAFTDHDRSLTLDDLTAEPLQGFATGAMEKSVGLSPDSASVTGALSSEAITESDLVRGLWDGARVDIFRVDWSAPDNRVHLFAGAIGDVRRGAHAFEAELRGLQAPLNVPVGRVFSRFCDADLGDGRCGVDIEAAEFRGEGVVTSIEGTQAFKASGLEGFADQWFSRGRIIWDGGAQSEISTHGAQGAESMFELLDAVPMNIGDAFTVYAGCDKRIETCRDKFANTISFRGFPHMPGNDALQASPRSGDQLDGGSRFR